MAKLCGVFWEDTVLMHNLILYDSQDITRMARGACPGLLGLSSSLESRLSSILESRSIFETLDFDMVRAILSLHNFKIS